MSIINWSSSLMITTNKITGYKRYYMDVCGYWRRVSKEAYYSRCDDATRSDCYLNINAMKLRRAYKTVYGTYVSKIS